MVTVKFSEFLDAFEFASSAPYESSAFVDLETGSLHCISDAVELDEDVPDDLDSSDRYLALPQKTDLDLGQRLALAFVEHHLPQEYDTVAGYFRKRGAYRRFKDLLDNRGALDGWYTFEAEATERALRQWCDDHGVQLSI